MPAETAGYQFLPRCMEWRRGLVMRKLSLCPSVRLSLCLSVCLSVKRVDCDKTEERSVPIFIPYERSLSLVFWKKNGWCSTDSTWKFGSTGPVGAISPIFNRYSLVAPQPSKKSSMNANRKFTARFPMTLRWSRGSKTRNGRFPSKIALRLKKVCYKVSLCENCQRKSYKAFIGLTIRAKIIDGDVPFYPKFWVKVTALERNRRFLISFRS